MRQAPRLSVVIPTYGRPEALRVAVRSVLECEHDSFELIVVDQNAESALGEFDGDGRMQVLRVERAGVAAARNLGAKAARGEIVAFLDDDCEAERGWIRAIEEGFDKYSEAGILLGSVIAGAHETGMGFIPACTRHAERLHRQFMDCPEIEVMGASLAIRKSVWESVGGFWEEIGPGKRMKAGEDYDLVVRVMRSGLGVLESPRVTVVHHGFRRWEEGRKLIEGYAYGTAYVVGYRVGWRPVEMGQCLWRFWRSYRGNRSNIVQSAREAGEKRLLSFGKGLAAGLIDCL